MERNFFPLIKNANSQFQIFIEIIVNYVRKTRFIDEKVLNLFIDLFYTIWIKSMTF